MAASDRRAARAALEGQFSARNVQALPLGSVWGAGGWVPLKICDERNSLVPSSNSDEGWRGDVLRADQSKPAYQFVLLNLTYKFDLLTNLT